MKNKLKKWPEDWIEHITKTCFFYFENHDISFIDSKILCSDKTKNAQIYCIQLIFKKYDKLYDVFINHEESTFIINYYYKNYYKLRKRKKFEKNFLFIMDTLLNGVDQIGSFNYFVIGAESSRDNIFSAYDMSKSIEEVINGHDKDSDNNDNDEGEEDPIIPYSPSAIKEPELLNC